MLIQSLNAEQMGVLRDRRSRLAARINFPVLLWSGATPSRNFPANKYPFRASSHFLFFAGLPIPHAVIRIDGGKLTLFVDDPTPSAALWHGPSPDREAIAAAMGADAAFPLAELPNHAAGAATIAVQHPGTVQAQSYLLGRSLPPAHQIQALDPIDGKLVQALVALRSCHDGDSIAEMRRAAAVSVAAHKAGMAATATATTEAQIRAAMEAVLLSHNMTPAYNSIVTVHGEVLHNEASHHPLAAQDLVLADVGAETGLGWAADITRTWPVSGRFSAGQRSLYSVVLAAHDACIAAIQPGVEYREIHLLACRILAEGLVDLGILQGKPEDLVEQDAHALFFPHGVGHLLGLDVHDMEDLGDAAGYAPGRVRSDRFGLGYLRLDRPLETGMVVTIEPGFYQVPAILENVEFRAKYNHCVNWERLAKFGDVRGIRIEDDVQVTATGAEVLTAALPTRIDAIEASLAGA
ncbi:MAG: aminopeptidase P family protein [Synechococcales cyanobacterium CRU_2_2]|nr:aminopeptidase P family protein [Synechococcales cyanobacterium CRU_2_2]